MKQLSLSRMLLTLWSAVIVVGAIFLLVSDKHAGISAVIGGAIVAFAQSWYLWRIAGFYKNQQIEATYGIRDEHDQDAARLYSEQALRIYYRAEAAKIAWLVVSIAVVMLIDQGRFERIDLDLNLAALFTSLILVQVFCVLVSSLGIARAVRNESQHN